MSFIIPSSEEQAKINELISFFTNLEDESPTPVKIFAKVQQGSFWALDTIGDSDYPYCLILPKPTVYEGVPYVGSYPLQVIMVFTEKNADIATVENLKSYILTEIFKNRQNFLAPYEIKQIQSGDVVNIKGLMRLFEPPEIALSFDLETVVRSLK